MIIGCSASALALSQPQIQMRALEEQKPAFEAYQSCIAEHRREVELHYAADWLIRFRDQRKMLEAGFEQNTDARQRYPGGVDQLGAEQFARYQSLGGTASSIAGVQPVASPCPTPGPVFPQRSPSAGSPIRDRRTIDLVPPK